MNRKITTVEWFLVGLAATPAIATAMSYLADVILLSSTAAMAQAVLAGSHGGLADMLLGGRGAILSFVPCALAILSVLSPRRALYWVCGILVTTGIVEALHPATPLLPYSALRSAASLTPLGVLVVLLYRDRTRAGSRDRLDMTDAQLFTLASLITLAVTLSVFYTPLPGSPAISGWSAAGTQLGAARGMKLIRGVLVLATPRLWGLLPAALLALSLHCWLRRKRCRFLIGAVLIYVGVCVAMRTATVIGICRAIPATSAAAVIRPHLVRALLLDCAAIVPLLLVLAWFWFSQPDELDEAAGVRCERCRYNLTGNVSGVCPECGTPIPGSEQRLVQLADEPPP